MITSRLPRMHPRLAELLDYLDAARARVLGEAARLPRDRWGIRPEPDRWSVAEAAGLFSPSSAALRNGLRSAGGRPARAALPTRGDPPPCGHARPRARG